MEEELYSTIDINDKIMICENIEEYKREIIPLLKNQRERWVEKLNEIIESKGYSKTRFAELCGVSRVAVNKWFNGSMPRQRELYIRIGFAAGYNIDEMNNFLIRFGRYQGLYAKCLEDSVCIYLLKADYLEHDYKTYNEILLSIKELITGNSTEEQETYETVFVVNELNRITSKKELLEFVEKNAGIYEKQYNKFYNYVLAFLKVNKINLGENKQASTNFMANGQDWSSSLRQCVSAINQRKWYPVRDKVISLGLHLNMDVEQINEMLNLTYMEELCAKNIFESAIIYALENAKLEDVIFCDGTDELCMYVKDILMELELEDVEFFLEELPNDY